MREIQPRTAATAVQVHGKTITTIMTVAAAVRVQTAAAPAVQALAAGVGAAAANKVKMIKRLTDKQ